MDKIGLHIIGGWRGNLGKPRVVKLVEVSPEYVREVRQAVGPACIIVVRWYEANQPLDDPVAAAQAWFKRHEAAMKAMAEGDPNVAFEGYNEVGDGQAAAYAAFEVERLRRMHAAGLCSVVGNFSVGTPDLPVWQAYQPMLNALAAGDFVGLHEYWVDSADIGNRWHCGRWTMVPQLAGRPIIVTECGRDTVEGKGQPGWKRSCSAETFVADLKAYNGLLEQFPNVVAAAVFTTPGPSGGWADFDPSPIWPRVIGEYTNPQTYPGASVPKPPAPEPPKEETVTFPPTIVQVPSPNFGYPTGGTHGRNGRRPIAICYHVVEGSLSALDNYLKTSASGVGYHYCAGKLGQVHQYVQEDDAAWANGKVAAPTWALYTPGVNPNLDTISISREGFNYEPVPEAQYQAILWLTKDILTRRGIPVSRDTLIGHFAIDSINKQHCPGDPFPWARLFADLAEWQKPPAEDEMARAIRNAAYNARGIPYNPDAAFPRYAREHNLGNPVTGEVDVNGYRLQGYAGGIVYAKIGDWANVKHMPW